MTPEEDFSTELDGPSPSMQEETRMMSGTGPRMLTAGEETSGKGALVKTDVSVPSILSEEELEAAASDIGMSRVRLRKWVSKAKLGAQLEKLGAVRVCAGDLVMSNQIRYEAIQKCRRALNRVSDPEHFVAIVEVLNKLLDSKDASSKMILQAIDRGHLEKPKVGDGPRLPPKGTLIVAQGVVVNSAPTNGNK